MSRFQILKSGISAMLLVVIAAACAGKKVPDPTGTVSGTISYGSTGAGTCPGMGSGIIGGSGVGRAASTMAQPRLSKSMRGSTRT